MVTIYRGEQEDRVAVRLPEHAEGSQRRLGQRHVAILGPFATMNVDHHALAVEITDLEIHRFPDPQPQGVSRPDEGLQPLSPSSVDDLEDLGLGDHFGQGFHVVQLGLIEDVPLARASRTIKELDPAQQDALGPRGNLFVHDLVQQKPAKVRLVDRVRWLLAEIRQFSDGANIAINGSFGFPGQLQIFDQLAVPLSFEVFAGSW